MSSLGSDMPLPSSFPSAGDVRDKRIVITGGSRGLGRVLAVAFSRAGAKVVIVGRREDSLKAASDLLPGPFLLFPGDVTDEQFNESVADGVVSEWGGLDVWISNAGISSMLASTLEVDARRFRRILDVNITGAFLGAKAAARVMTAGGRIIFTGSVLGQRAHPLLSAYSASKGAILSLVQSLAIDLGPRAITVNAVVPGWFESPLAEAWNNDAEATKTILTHTAMHRWGIAEDLVGAYFFLASEASSFVSGGTITVDGGYLAK
jgi:NAD(P)-dependent dehydrogenase (short-subunit alcohol dehydrogenase family)